MERESFEMAKAALGSSTPRRSPFRALLPLLLFTIVLLLFIAWLGDWRRQHNFHTQMSRQAADYAKLMGDAKVLPLNLNPSLPLDPARRIIDNWIAPDDARTLRDADHAVMAAWSVPLVRVLGRDERAVIFFHQGRFDVRWLDLREFDAQFARQIAKAKRLAP